MMDEEGVLEVVKWTREQASKIRSEDTAKVHTYLAIHLMYIHLFKITLYIKSIQSLIHELRVARTCLN